MRMAWAGADATRCGAVGSKMMPFKSKGSLKDPSRLFNDKIDVPALKALIRAAVELNQK